MPARLTIFSHRILSICNIYLFPVLVLRVGFAFCLLQFLFVAFLLLSIWEGNLYLGPSETILRILES